MRWTVGIFALGLVACFDPHYDAPQCSPGGACPDGFTCQAGQCIANGTPIDGPRLDAPLDAPRPIDAMPIDADSSACHQEMSDVANGTSFEATGKTGPGPVPIICGQFDDKAPVGGVIDKDMFQFTAVGGPVGIRVSAPGASAFTGGVTLQVAQIYSNLAGDDGLITARVPGAVQLSLTASSTTQLGMAIPYQISVEALDTATRCPPIAATYTEQLDTSANMNQGNDVLVLNGPMTPPSLSASTTDAPEATTTPLGAGVAVEYGGTAATAATHTDMYNDRDTYQLVTGPSTDELDLDLSYTAGPQTQDIDVYLVRQSDLRQVALGYTVGPEVMSLRVEPNTSYYLTLGLYSAGTADQPYTIGVCGQTAP